MTGSDFSVTGILVSLTLSAETSTGFTAVLTPIAAGSDTGALTITTNPDVGLPPDQSAGHRDCFPDRRDTINGQLWERGCGK